MRAWYFARDDFTSGKGKTLTDHMEVELPLVLCSHGLHASLRIHDALTYAQGTLLCRTEHSGEILEGDDKLCSQERRIVAKADATRILHEHALWCAEYALSAVDEDKRDPRSLEALHVKRLWLDGKATDEELQKARAASRDAARSAARATSAAAWAASDAAWDAAWAAIDDDIEQRALELLGCE